MIGFITFRLAQREFACRLDAVREVVRLTSLEVLPGMSAPISGLLELRGNPLPVIDLRHVDESARGDVLVLAEGVEAIGVAVDQVTGVHDEDDLVGTDDEKPSGLPHYVVEVMRRRDTNQPVLLVDLQRLVTVVAA